MVGNPFDSLRSLRASVTATEGCGSKRQRGGYRDPPRNILTRAAQAGRKFRCDPVAERFLDDEEANRRVVRARRKRHELPGTS